ncbi:MAG: transcription termination/antitermination protein NusA, partial [Ruminococcus sp.]|nr:transcription termination/antitermination protein NusA [Ruminococcus sp.]
EVYLVRSEQIPGEVLTPGDIIKVYIVNIVNPDTRPSIKISRTHRDLVKRLFELEVPEIADGTVQVKAISRVAGARSKMAVYSEDKNVDAVGACIGPRKSRISSVVNELKGEKIDIITWVEDKAEFIAKALAPATVLDVETGEDNGTKVCRVTVPDDQLSLAIGNKGQNAKLAAGLTGYKIDIISDKDPKPEPLPQPAPKEELPDEPEEDTDLLAEDGTEDTQE